MRGSVELYCRQERQRLRRAVEDAHRLLEHFHNRERNGELSRAAAQRLAAELIRITRYASEITAWIYLFVVASDGGKTGPALLVHPYEEEGEVLVGNGYLAELVSGLATVARSAPCGYVLYYWLRYGHGVVEPKLAYYRVFQPWGWAVASSCYVTDVLRVAGFDGCPAELLPVIKSCVMLEVLPRCACGAEIRPCCDEQDCILCPRCGATYQLRALRAASRR